MIDFKITYLIVGLTIIFSLPGCNEHKTEFSSEEEMTINITRADEDEKESYVLLFWYANDLNLIGTLSNPQPYHIARPVEYMNEYTSPKPPYNTGIFYPKTNAPIAAIGVSPDFPINVTDYSELIVPPNQIGSVDLMASKPIYGTSSSPFSKIMEFEHLQSKVSFRAIRKNDMANYVQKVEVTVTAKEQLAEKIIWNNTKLVYEPSFYVSENLSYTFGQSEKTPPLEQIPEDSSNASYGQVGDVYLYPGLSELRVSVTAQIAPPAANIMDPQYTTTIDGILVRFVNNFQQNIILNAGDSYEVTLIFENSGIELMGRKCNWKNGGNIVLPVPIPSQGSAGV